MSAQSVQMMRQASRLFWCSTQHSVRMNMSVRSSHLLTHRKCVTLLPSDTARKSYSSTPFECITIQDTEHFDRDVLGNEKPVLVDFHATWCGPCKLLSPRLEAVLGAKDGQVILAKVDVDNNTELAIEYGVNSVPTVLAVKNGKVLDSFIGLLDTELIDGFVDKLRGP